MAANPERALASAGMASAILTIVGALFVLAGLISGLGARDDDRTPTYSLVTGDGT